MWRYRRLCWRTFFRCDELQCDKWPISLCYISSYRDKVDSNAPHTLQSRILKYLRTADKYKKNTIEINKNNIQTVLHYFDKVTLDKTIAGFSQNQLLHFIYELSENGVRLSREAFDDTIQHTDEECSYRFQNMDKTTILKYLDAWFYVIPQRITNLKFYSLFCNQVPFWVADNYYMDYLIPSVFYIGLQKKTLLAKRILNQCIKYIDSSVNLDYLTIEELCILLNAMYKTSTRITSIKLLKSTCSKVDSNLRRILLDPPMFVTLIKSLRHAQYHNTALLDKTANILTSEKNVLENFNFTGRAHLLALYADSLCLNNGLIHLFVNSSVNYLLLDCKGKSHQSDHLIFRPRVKDVSTFLWAVSYLGFIIDQKIMEGTILPFIMERLKQGEYERRPEEITNSLLSIWVMGYKPVTLFERAVTKKGMRTLKEMSHCRYNSRLALLLTSVKIEAPHLLNKEHLEWMSIYQVAKTNLVRHLQKREFLQQVHIAVKCLASHLEIESFGCDFYIPYLNIAGITVKTPGHVMNIEVLDPTVCLYKSQSPHGLMKLKLRLLKELGNDVIVITQQQFEYLEDISHLYVYLEDELTKHNRRVCREE